MNAEEARKEIPGGQEFHWRWIFASLFGLAIFLYLGWIYQSSWWWYYGIDPSRMGLSPVVILEQGMLFSLISLFFILVIFSVIFLLRLIVLFIRNFLPGDRHAEMAGLFSIRGFFKGSLHFVAPLYVALLYVFKAGVSKNSNYGDLQMPASVPTLEMFMIPIAAILVIRLLGDLLHRLPERFRQRLRLRAEFPFDDGPVRVLLGVLVIVCVLVIFTATVALGDASVGCRNDGCYQAVRQVSLVSYAPIAGLDRYRQGCDCSPYVYGPLAYLGSNEDYLFLVPWKADGETDFPQFPPLYQIERSPTYLINIVPFGDPVSPPGDNKVSSFMDQH